DFDTVCPPPGGLVGGCQGVASTSTVIDTTGLGLPPSPISGNALFNGGAGGTIELAFSGPVSAVAFDYATTSPTGIDVSGFLNGVLLATINFPTIPVGSVDL